MSWSLSIGCRLWRAAFSDGALNEHEGRLMRRAGLVLGLTEAEIQDLRATHAI